MKTSSQIFLGGIVFTATLCVVGFALAFWWAAHEYRKPGPLQETKFYEVKKGSGLYDIAAGLKEAGAVDNPYIFILGARVKNAQGELKAGEYELTPGMSVSAIMQKIRKGEVYARRVTVREGLTSYEVAEILKGVADLEGDIPAIPPEGSLLPQTYDYRLHETRVDILSRMQADMTQAMNELWPQRASNLPFNTPQEAMTLASIVEKETGVETERKKVAGVFINRLRKGIALQTDPTVIYALTNGRPKNDGQGPLGRRLLSKDLQFESPYNTYLHPGLPPGPIANPGRASIEAVLHPEDHNFIYFVADGTGGHVFAETLEEHNKNVSEWQKIRKEKND
ncbi:MAG: endolytic transglycosylase MltG [Alphaproteobacteria bacterium]|nr:endolytic transglycosylase MltG [Alphaproteobacteria bacterium]